MPKYRINSSVTLKRLLLYGRPYISIFIIGLLMLWLAAMAEVAGPMIISYFIDHILAKKFVTLSILMCLVVGFFILQIFSATLRYYQAILFNYISLNIVRELRAEAMSSILYKPLSMFNIKPIGEFISILTNDTEVVKDLYMIVLASTLRSIALITTVLIAMFLLNWRLACIALCLFPVVIVIMCLYQYYSTNVIRQLRKYVADINAYFNEIINGMHIIQQFSQQQRFAIKLNEISSNHLKTRVATLRLEGYLLRPFISLIFVFVLCGILLYFSLYYTSNILGVGILYAFINYLSRLNEPLIEIISRQSIMQQAIISGERIFSLMDNPMQQYGMDVRPLSKGGNIIFKNVSFSNSNNKLILQHVSFIVPSRSLFALVGNSGSGKSVIVNLIMKYFSITEGLILLDNRPIDTLSREVLRQGIATIQQESIIMTESVYINITLGRSISESKVWNVLKQVQLYGLIQSLPNKLQSNLGEQGNILSVGQKQLLALARVLVCMPSILILDEATSHIDSITEQYIINILKKIQDNTTIFIIAHRLSTIIDADKILVLHNGQIVEQGNHKSLLEIRGYYHRIYGSVNNN